MIQFSIQQTHSRPTLVFLVSSNECHNYFCEELLCFVNFNQCYGSSPSICDSLFFWGKYLRFSEKRHVLFIWSFGNSIVSETHRLISNSNSNPAVASHSENDKVLGAAIAHSTGSPQEPLLPLAAHPELRARLLPGGTSSHAPPPSCSSRRAASRPLLPSPPLRRRPPSPRSGAAALTRPGDPPRSCPTTPSPLRRTNL